MGCVATNVPNALVSRRNSEILVEWPLGTSGYSRIRRSTTIRGTGFGAPIKPTLNSAA